MYFVARLIYVGLLASEALFLYSAFGSHFFLI